MKDSAGDQNTATIMAQVIVPPAPPALELISIAYNPAAGATDALVSFTSSAGGTYTVQYTDSLMLPTTWSTLGTATLNNGILQIVDPTARSTNHRFYRAVLQWP
jgi:hypothetical protein